MSLVLVVLATAACQDAFAPTTTDSKVAVGSPSNTAASSALVIKPKKNTPVIESVQLSTSSLELNTGSAASYSVAIYNPFGRRSRTYSDAYLQGEIRQGGVVAATGGFPVMCNGGAIGALPLGNCTVSGLTISTIPGAGSLVPGAADFAVTLYSQSDAFASVTVTVPVMLGEALVTP